MLYLGVILVFVMEYVRPAYFLPFLNAFYLNTLVPLSVTGLSLMKTEGPANIDIMKTREALGLFILLGLIGTSIFTADVKLYVFNTFKVVLGYCFIFFIIAKNVDSIRKIGGVFVILIVVHVFLVFLSPDTILNPEKRSYIAQGFFLGDGNDFALSVNIVIPFCIYLAFESRKRLVKLFFLACMLFLALCIIGTSSRGGTISLIIVIAYQLIKSRKKAFGLAATAFLLSVVFAYAPPNYFERMGTIKNYESEGSAMGRIMAWESSLRMAADHPILGVGAGHFPVKYGVEYRPPGFGRTDLPWSNAHSVYFQLLGELGLPGLIVLLSLLASGFKRNEAILKRLKERDDDRNRAHGRLFVCLNSSLLAFAVGAAFLSVAYYPHLYVLAGLMAAGHFIDKRWRNSSEEALIADERVVAKG